MIPYLCMGNFVRLFMISCGVRLSTGWVWPNGPSPQCP